MKTFNQNQKGSAVIWIIAIVVIAAVVYLISRQSNKPVETDLDQELLATASVTIMVPSDLAAFRKAAVAHVQVGGPDPLPSTTFVPVKAIPNTVVADFRQNAAEAAAEYIQTQAGTSSLVVYFKVVNGTAYIILNMDIDGWAGVSAAIAQVHPIVEKTLLAKSGITAVKFGPAPGDTIDEIQKEYMNRSSVPITSSIANWKTYTNSTYHFSFKYPADWVVTTSPEGSQNGGSGTIIQSPEVSNYLAEHSDSTGGPMYDIAITEHSNQYSNSDPVGMKVKFNGIDAISFTTTGDGAFQGFEINRQSTIFEIRNLLPDNDIKSKILSTFKFTN